MPTPIIVSERSLYPFGEEPVTVQRFEDGELVWCNHAGAESEIVQHQINNIDSPDDVWETTEMVCNKINCRAYLVDGHWENTPIGGVYGS